MAAVPNWRANAFSMLEAADRPELLRELRRSIVIASRLQIDTLILLAGNVLEHLSHEEQLRRLTETCKRCAEIGEAANVTFVLEALNGKTDHPGALFLNTLAMVRTSCRRSIKTTSSPPVRLLSPAGSARRRCRGARVCPARHCHGARG